jgi:hypothetical protein
LYSIGFLGVIRNEQTTFVYNDPGTIEYYETQFVIHPAFREALRSTSSVDLIQYEPTLFDASLSRIQSEISGGFSSRRGSIKGVRGGSAYRLVNYVQEMCERIEMATVTSGLPEEVRAEVRRNLRSVNADAEKALNVDNSEITIHDLPQRSLKFFSNLKLKLRDSQLLDDDRNTELSYALESAIEELQRGLIYGESLEA